MLPLMALTRAIQSPSQHFISSFSSALDRHPGELSQVLTHSLDPQLKCFAQEFLRLWFRERCDPYKDATLPEAPKELVMELSKR